MTPAQAMRPPSNGNRLANQYLPRLVLFIRPTRSLRTVFKVRGRRSKPESRKALMCW